MHVNMYVYMYVCACVYTGVIVYIFIDVKKASHGFEAEKSSPVLCLLFLCLLNVPRKFFPISTCPGLLHPLIYDYKRCSMKSYCSL